MKWLFYVIVFAYMFYRTVYGEKATENHLIIDNAKFEEGNYFKVGDEITISCKAQNINQVVEWVDKNGKVVTRAAVSERMFTQKRFIPGPRGRYPALTLTITSAELKDSGMYNCRSRDQRNVESVSVCVLDPVQFVESSTEITVDAGRTITLVCPAKGDPEPRFSWEKNGEPIIGEDSSSKYEMVTICNLDEYQGMLMIRSLEPEDRGVYTCVAHQQSEYNEKCTNSNTKNITLNVRHAPVFDVNDTLVYVQNNRVVELKCSADAYPAPAYKWIKEGKNTRLVLHDAKMQFLEDRNQSILQINSNNNIGQVYTCEASNVYGTMKKYFTLVKIEEPTQPIEVNCNSTTDSSVELNVIWDQETLFPVSAFDIQYIKDLREPSRRINVPKDWRKSRTIEHSLEEETIPDPDSASITVTLEGLEEETNYWVKLRAVNSAGESPWSDPILVSTASAAAPVEVTTTEDPVEASSVVNEPVDMSDSTYYGIFFAGGILVVAFVCMFAMRMVK